MTPPPGRHPVTGRDRGRHPQRRPTPPRRPAGRAAGPAVLGELGQHNGLPAAIIVSTSLTELQSRAGHALTGGGTLLPMSDVIRLASHANHYLRIFDHGRELALYHTKRLASPGQRIVLYAKDRGCSFPNCDVPGYLTEVHHVTDFAQCQETDINELTQGCGPHHQLATTGAGSPANAKTAPPNGFPSPPRPWTTPHQQLLSPRKTPARQRRRRSMSERRNLCVAGEPSDQQPLPLVTVIA